MLELKLSSGLATTSWWNAKVEHSVQNAESNQMELRKKWSSLGGRLTMFLAEYLSLVDYPDSLFSCCKIPEVVAADGNLFFI